MLVHICCSVDSHYFLQMLQKEFPNDRLVGFFYDPNIHPYSEYRLRLLDVERSCKKLGVELIEGDYDTKSWLDAVRGFEKEPEKGKRCSICFDRRFEVSARKAQELGELSFTSTLLTSPKKSLTQLQKAGDALAKEYGLKFLAPDYRQASGTQEQNRITKEDALYRQDYCGCIFGLTMQREGQKKLADELFVPLSGQIQPESIEERLAMYEKRLELEERNIPHKIIKQRFLNWRLLGGVLLVKRSAVPAHILPYSTLKGEYSRGRVEYAIGDLHYMNRDEVRFLTLESYNRLCQTSYASVAELMVNPPDFESEVALRQHLEQGLLSLSLIMVVDKIPDQKLEILLQSKVFSDVRELLIEL